MVVRELIEKLSKLPLDVQGCPVYMSNNDGCPDCDPEGMGNLNDVYEVTFKEEGNYPYHEKKNIVVIG